MKKVLFTLVILMSVFTAKAFEFDGIDLNAKYIDVVREVAAKGATVELLFHTIFGLLLIFVLFTYGHVAIDLSFMSVLPRNAYPVRYAFLYFYSVGHRL